MNRPLVGVLALLTSGAAAAAPDCYADAESAYRQGRAVDASRLYREAARREACAAERAVLSANGAMALAGSLSDRPGAAHCAVADGYRAALQAGLGGQAAEEARVAMQHAARLCLPPEASPRSPIADGADSAIPALEVQTASVVPGGAKEAESTEKAPNVPYAALLPEAAPQFDARADVLGPSDESVVRESAYGTYAYTSLVIGGATAVASSAFLALAWDAYDDRASAARDSGRAEHESEAKARYLERYAAADRDVVAFGQWFYGLSGAACVFLTTGVTLLILDDEPSEAPARVALGGR